MQFGKIVIGILAIILAVGYLLSGLNLISEINLGNSAQLNFLLGLGVFIPMWIFLLRKRHFFSTFEHEFTHLLVGLLFFKKPAKFTATESEGGVTSMYGGNFLITLAPYFLPTFVYLILPLSFMLKASFIPYYFATLGFLTCYHLLSSIQEFGYYQSDIYKTGKLFSTIFLIFANILCYGIILAFVLGGFKLTGKFITGGVVELIDLVVGLIGKD